MGIHTFRCEYRGAIAIVVGCRRSCHPSGLPHQRRPSHSRRWTMRRLLMTCAARFALLLCWRLACCLAATDSGRILSAALASHSGCSFSATPACHPRAPSTAARSVRTKKSLVTRSSRKLSRGCWCAVPIINSDVPPDLSSARAQRTSVSAPSARCTASHAESLNLLKSSLSMLSAAMHHASDVASTSHGADRFAHTQAHECTRTRMHAHARARTRTHARVCTVHHISDAQCIT